MVRRAFTLICAVLLLGGCGAGPSEPADPPLWVVRDTDTTIWLFGTVHFLRPETQWFDGPVREAFDASDLLVLELVQPAGKQAGAIMQRLGRSNAGAPLDAALTPEQRAALDKALARFDIDPQDARHYDPWFAAMALGTASVRAAGYSAANGAEAILAGAADDADKPVRGFETLAQQLGYFDALSPGAQHALLVGTLEGLDEAPARMARTAGAWAKGDTGAIARLVDAELDRSQEAEQVLVHDRNARWAGWIARRMARPGTVFVAVGAGHLVGPDRVQAMLAARGLAVVRVQ